MLTGRNVRLSNLLTDACLFFINSLIAKLNSIIVDIRHHFRTETILTKNSPKSSDFESFLEEIQNCADVLQTIQLLISKY